MIKVWSFDFWNVQEGEGSNSEDPGAVQRAFHRNMARMVALEDLGFEGVFFSEHHFLNALSPSPHLLIAAVAQRTQRLKLGVLGDVLAFHHPWRLAEELAMLDYLTDGRLEIGTASGVPPEFMFVNIDPKDARPMYAEILEFLDAARAGKIVNHKGKYWQFEDLPAMPRPRPETRRREWMTAYTPGTAAFAAKRSSKLALGFQSVDGMVKVFDAYREAMKEEGRPASPDDMMVRRQVLLWDTDAQASELHTSLLDASRRRMAETFGPLAKRTAKLLGQAVPEGVAVSGVKDAQRLPSPDASVFTNLLDAIVHPGDEFIFGSPETVAERIIDQCRRTGAGNVACYHPAVFDEAQLEHHYKLWRQVVPLLHAAEIA